jgi:hypothetical protein
MKQYRVEKLGVRRPRRRHLRSLVGSSTCLLAAVVALLALAMSVAGSSLADTPTCGNAARRAEQSSRLPDCRAYELVTPQNKDSGEPRPVLVGIESYPLRSTLLATTPGARSSLSGDRFAWASEIPLPGSVAPGLSYLATRESGGWASVNQVPALSVSNDLLCPWQTGISGWSPELSRGILDIPAGPPRGFKEEGECGHDEPRLVPGEPEAFHNLFVHDSDGGGVQLVNVTPPLTPLPLPEEVNQEYLPASFLAGSDDLSHVVFEEELKLTPDAPIGYRGGDELYEWSGGTVRLVTILPGGQPVSGRLAGATRNYLAFEPSNVAQFRHAVSADGRRIFFEAEGALYMREDGTRTVELDTTHGPDPSGGGRFMLAGADGSKAFFLSDHRLTADSTATAEHPDLYEFEVGPETLTDLTVDPTEAANVLGVSGASEDGSYVYFVATAALTGGQANSEGAVASAGQPNLFLLHGGQLTFVATLNPATDECDWVTAANCAGISGSGLTARISANGSFAGFDSTAKLTTYDNTDANTHEPDLEIYLYDAAANRLTCASCNPAGTPPVGGAAIRWPAQQSLNNNWRNLYPQHNVSDRGQVFFETVDSLLPRDTNGRDDVYEYESGQLYLISSGVGESDARFLDATPDGNNVFFATAEPLLPRDVDATYDYYDARVEGGFPEAGSSEPGCDAGSCRVGAAPPPVAAPGSTQVNGTGNVHHRRKHRHRRHRHRHGKHHHRHGKHRRRSSRHGGRA